MKQTKQERGITLVALIITIIVLLILAVVTIAAVTGDSIINHAENARDTYRKGMEDENSMLKTYEDYLAQATGKTNGNNTEDNSTLVDMFKAGTLKVGDYVDYKPTEVTTAYNPDGETVGSKTGYTTAQSFSQENINWRVLGFDEANNQILLISGAPTTSTLTLYGHVGYNNAEDVLNDTCEILYSNSTIGATARSINMEDIDTYLGGNAYDKTTYNGGSNNFGGYGYTRNFTNINTPDNWKGRNKGEWSGSLTSNGYEYDYRDYISDDDKLSLLVGNKEIKYHYFIATRNAFIPDDKEPAQWNCADIGDVEINISVYTGSYLCFSNGSQELQGGCLRPVVSLSSKTNITQVPKLESIPTETWNDPLRWY